MGKACLAGALALVAATALAQEAPPAANPPAPESVGPKELQNFTLNGTVTRQADQSAVPPPAAPKRDAQAAPERAPAKTPPRAVQTAAAPPPARRSQPSIADPPARTVIEAAPDSAPPPSPASSVTVALPKLDGASTASSDAQTSPASAPAFAPDPQPSGTLAPGHSMPLLPWLLAAMVLGAAGAFLFWRRRREALAGGPQIDLFTAPAAAPSPAPAPKPAPAPPNAPQAASVGVVSTRLRPWIEIGFQPLRCIVEDHRVIVEFEIELFNSGSAPALGVLVEGSLFNAGAAHDAELGAFFANPVVEGERIPTIPPLKRASLSTRVAFARDQLQAYDLGGRQGFVPLIGFNALYSWSGGEGQTSVAYLLGRDTKGEKLAPFHLDLGPRIFRGLAARLLPTGVRN